ncbi:hypothetical protein FOQG_09668 [Fusarium oxysporum f. sp. raphani 54005]|uniref:Uncharacterized protein n=3 Tax=Fusarium oxysporum TaxID=5507 RepID=X0BWW9_FUSOX|nr:hypothetical protein FOQG_09668 [Fusarium oxysporum f. sp. raphani 54005]KAG7427801.1 hypothetical protein Forpi1262_v010241 [Fusarium oxysporum f. sp. raphani]KAJ4049082.1 hypothetical protein NW753_008081 [Fusarium oxysporum]TVY74300.1 hypothetical protein Focb16_v005300 [Fusarium oxysporum f. sp. cubense]KAJ4049664.1 hypothetical protein NW763_008962 [Fusarium oxysporum]
MKFNIVLISLAALASQALADPHGLCACQKRTNGPTNDDATQACCSRVGAQLTSDRLPAQGGIKYAGYYCQGNDISGNAFYRCCRNNGGGDSTCPE